MLICSQRCRESNKSGEACRDVVFDTFLTLTGLEVSSRCSGGLIKPPAVVKKLTDSLVNLKCDNPQHLDSRWHNYGWHRIDAECLRQYDIAAQTDYDAR